MPAEGGIRFGQYVLLRRIARGGMAEVFLAQQRGLEGFDRRVAVKRILPHLADSPDFTKMFLGEAKLAAQLSHPNVVHIYDFGKNEGDYFIAMEYVEGVHAGQLFKHGAEHDKLPPTLVARIGADAASALHYAHEMRGGNGKPLGLVHRDVSPANIMISFDGVVKLCDFGIAKAAALSDQLTNPGQVKGKYAYMSPEQTIAAPLDGRSDVFSLAIVLWELLAGRYIVSRGDAIEAMRAIRDGKLDPIERAAPGVPTALAQALTWALQPKREQRASAADLAQALEAFIKSSPELGNSMQLGAWVRERFPREGTGQHPALAGPAPTTSAVSPGTVASPGTVIASGTQGPLTPPREKSGPSRIVDRLADRASQRGFGNDLDEEGAQTLKRAPSALRGDATLIDDAAARRAAEEATLRDKSPPSLGDDTEIVDARPTVERQKTRPPQTGDIPTSVAPAQRPARATPRNMPAQAAASGPRPVAVPASGPRRITPVSIESQHRADDVKKRRLRIAAAIAGLAGLALISFAIALAASGGGGSSHARAHDDAVAMRPIDAPQLATTAPADAAPAPPTDAAPEPTFPPDAADMPTTLFEISTIPPGGSVRIGDQGGARMAPAKFALVEGRYEVYAELPGYAPEHRSVDVPRGEHFAFEIAFTHKLSPREHVERPPHPVAEIGKLSVKTEPYSDVYEGGRYLGQTPLAELALSAGTHELTFKNPSHAPYKQTITIAAGKTKKLSLNLP